jgi:hypothetical protein
MKLRHAALAAAALCCASAAFADPIGDLIATGLTPATPSSSPTTLTLDSATMLAIAQWLLVLVGTAGGALIHLSVKDDKKRQALEALWDHLIGWGFAVTPGAIRGRVLTVELGSKVAANALRRGLSIGKELLDHFGVKPNEAAEQLLARIPGIDGEVAADIGHQIAAAAQGHAPPLDAAAALDAFGPEARAAVGKFLPVIVAAIEKAAAARNGDGAIASSQQQSTEAAPLVHAT